MSHPYARLVVVRKDNPMRKPRMTVAEKAFVERVSSIVFATPEIRDGKRYLDRKTFAMLSEATQKRYLNLLASKTR